MLAEFDRVLPFSVLPRRISAIRVSSENSCCEIHAAGGMNFRNADEMLRNVDNVVGNMIINL